MIPTHVCETSREKLLFQTVQIFGAVRMIFSNPNFSIFILFSLLVLIFESRADQSEKVKKKHDDYYTSMVGVQRLARREQELVRRMLRYKQKLEHRLHYVKAYLDDYKETVGALVQNVKPLQIKAKDRKYPVFKDEKDLELIAERTSANPILVFRLLRRFTQEFVEFAANNEEDIYPGFKDYIDKFSTTMSLPQVSDLFGAAEGILRLQETYQLPTHQLSKGRLIDKETGCGLHACDMHLIGVQASDFEMYGPAAQWLHLALQQVPVGDDLLREIIKDNLAYAASKHNEEFLSFDSEIVDIFSNLISSNFSNIPNLYIPPRIKAYKLGISADTFYDGYNFNALCRGEQLRTPKETKNLRCWYSKQSFYNVISPLKVEMHLENPPIYQIYELLSDQTISHLKHLATPAVKRAMVLGDSKSGETSDVRTSSVAWIYDRDDRKDFDEVVARVPRIVEEVTGLNAVKEAASEELQISCYGSIGGHYIPHLDALLPTEKLTSDEDLFKGDRVATLMFYLTDVELGGGTAFPKLGVVSKAVKGSAILWYNLRFNGQTELLMLHGGCPVLHGNKWVANKWMRLYEQWHVRKCTKERFV